MADYKISLGIDVDVSDIQSQINTKAKNLDGIPIKVEIENLKDLKSQIQDLGKDNKNALTLDTSSIEKSLDRLSNTITDIKASLGTLDNKSGMNSLLSSVNQIATALGKVENESDNLVKSLSALSKKDFSINLGLNMGKSAAQQQGAYGDLARKTIIPQLRQQVDSIVQQYNIAYGTVSDAQDALINLTRGTKAGFNLVQDIVNDKKNNLFTRMSDGSNLKQQIAALTEYITLFEQAANVKNPQLASSISGVSQTANKLETDAKNAREGVTQLDESLQKLKGVLGSGIDAEGLSVALEPITQDLKIISEFIDKLSKNNSIDGLTDSFNRLSKALEPLTANFKNIQDIINTGFSDANTGIKNEDIIPDSGEVVKSAEQVGREIGEAIENAVEQTLDIDDVIDKEVDALMTEFGVKGKQAREDIKKALVNYRNNRNSDSSSSITEDENGWLTLDDDVANMDELDMFGSYSTVSGIRQVTDAILENKTAVKETDKLYEDLLRDVQAVNASKGTKKVQLLDMYSEWGDDYATNKKLLGSWFSDKYTDAINISEWASDKSWGSLIDFNTNHQDIANQIIRLIKEAKGIEKVGSNFSDNKLFEEERIKVEDVEAAVIAAADNIDRAEQKMAQSSTEATQTIVQNENNQQQALEDALERKKQRLEEINKLYEALDRRNAEIASNLDLSDDEKKIEIASITEEFDKLEQEENLLKVQIESINSALESEAQQAQETANTVVKSANEQVQAIERVDKVYEKISRDTSLVRDDARFRQVFGTSNQEAKEAQKHFQELLADEKAVVSVTEKFDDDNALQSFTVSVKRASGEVETLRYAMEDLSQYTGIENDWHLAYQGGTVSDGNVEKQLEKRIKAANDLQIQLNKIKSGYDDKGAAKPIKDAEHISALDEQYKKVEKAIEDVRNADDSTSASMIANAKEQKTILENMVREYRNAENVSSQMKGNSLQSGIDIAKQNYKKLIAEAKGYAVDFSKLETLNIDSIKTKDKLDEFTDALRVARAELNRLKAEASSTKKETDSTNKEKALGIDVDKLRRDINSLSAIDPKINDFKVEIDGAEVSVKSLLDSLDNINVQSDLRVARKNFESFTDAAEKAGIAVTEAQKKSVDKKASDEEAKKINQTYKDIYDTRKKIGSLEVDLIGAEAKGDAQTVKDINDEITRLKANLATLESDNIGAKFTDEQKTSLKELRKQIQYDKKQAQNSVDYKSNLKDEKDEAKRVLQAEKAEIKRVNDVYNQIYNLKKKIGSLEVELIGEDETNKAQDIRREIERLKNELSTLDVDGALSSKFTDKQKASLESLEKQIEYNKRQANNDVDNKLKVQLNKDEIKQTEESFESLKSLAREIGNIRLDIFNSNDEQEIGELTVKLRALIDEYDELYAKTNLNNRQQGQLDRLVDQQDTKAIKEYNGEIKELIQLQSVIENMNFEVGKLEFLGGKENEIEALEAQIKSLEDAYDHMLSTLMKKASANGDINFGDIEALDNGIVEATKNAEAKLERFKAQWTDTRNALAEKIKIDIELGNYEDDLSNMYAKLDKLSSKPPELSAALTDVKMAFEKLNEASELNADGAVDTERLIQAQKDYAAAIERTNNLINKQARVEAKEARDLQLKDNREVFQAKIDAWMTKNSAATKKFGDKLLELRAKAETADQVTLNHLNKELVKVDKAAEKAGLKMQSIGDRIKTKAKEYMAYFSVAEVFMEITQALKAMFNTVVEIDTAMTGLYRVTDLTASQYDTLFNNMISSAKEYGATLNDIINATTDWVRAGFEADTALGLAEVTTMYQHISDLDYDTAAENLITAYNGFKDELNGAFGGDTVSAVGYIADILNELDRHNCP